MYTNLGLHDYYYVWQHVQAVWSLSRNSIKQSEVSKVYIYIYIYRNS